MLGLGLARGALERCIAFCRQKTVNGRPLIEENWVRIALGDMLAKIAAVRAKLLDFAIAADTFLVMRLLDKPYVKAALSLLPPSLLLGDSVLALAKNPAVSGAVSRFKHREVPDKTVAWFKGLGGAAKVLGTDLAVEVSSRVLDIVGLEGAAMVRGMEKIFRDAKVSQIYEGTNQVNLLGVADQFLGKGAPRG